jgi:tRNA 2-(methylsulfanyl)-N6-isopentenyladenosine37 hydroxylase
VTTPLRSSTDKRWVDVALGDFDAVLLDHAHCEKKAAATAMALVSDYPERNELVRRLARLAREELRHFTQVHRIVVARGLTLARDRGDPYAKELVRLVRHAPDERRTDRLLVASLIEARSAERLQLLAEALGDAELRVFYAGLAEAEAGHHRLFSELARRYDPSAPERLAVLAEAEAEIVAKLPLAPRIH